MGAVEDFNACLDIRRKHLPSDSRVIAETLYQLGVAQEFNQQFDDAVNSLNNAIDVLKKHIENSKEPTEDERKELEALVPEIMEKIKDIKETKEECETSKRSRQNELPVGKVSAFGDSSSGSVESKDAALISSSLIKKKTSNESSASEEAKQRS